MAHSFFLSYSRNDARGNRWLDRFYKDLARDVAKASGVSSDVKLEDIGFKDDIGIETGFQWTQELAQALQSSKVFVCLFSYSYFNSKWCGKEFQVFLDRMKANVPVGGDLPPLILPVLWDFPDRLPKLLPNVIDKLNLQRTHASYGVLYATQGLEYVLRREEEKEYQGFLIPFSRLIAERSEKYPLPSSKRLESWDQVKSAFHLDEVPTPAPSPLLPETAPLPTASGPRVAWFVYVAGRQEDYEGIRTIRECYGDGGAKWRPYMPPKGSEAGIITQRVVTPRDILRETLPLSKNLIKDLRTAENKNTIVLLIVDPWISQLEWFKAPVKELDQQRLRNCAVIVIWNENDTETSERAEELRSWIDETFDRYFDSHDVFFRDSVKSEAELEAELAAAIEWASKKIMNRGRRFRPVDSTGGPLPKL